MSHAVIYIAMIFSYRIWSDKKNARVCHVRSLRQRSCSIQFSTCFISMYELPLKKTASAVFKRFLLLRLQGFQVVKPGSVCVDHCGWQLLLMEPRNLLMIPCVIAAHSSLWPLQSIYSLDKWNCILLSVFL